jgi:hypothetical protein
MANASRMLALEGGRAAPLEPPRSWIKFLLVVNQKRKNFMAGGTRGQHAPVFQWRQPRRQHHP